MNQIRYKLMQWMQGRNGIDGLGYATMALYFVLLMADWFLGTVWLTALGLLLAVLMLYRFLSRNLVRRRRENERFMGVFNKVKAFFKQTVRRIKDIKTHRYRTCPGCRVTLRLPVRRGKHTVVCPRCKQRVHVRVWL